MIVWVGARMSCVFCVESSVYLVVLQSHMFVPQKRLVKNSMPCQLKTLLHQHWSQMKAVVQLFKGK